jgi:hypothetical protein
VKAEIDRGEGSGSTVGEETLNGNEIRVMWEQAQNRITERFFAGSRPSDSIPADRCFFFKLTTTKQP